MQNLFSVNINDTCFVKLKYHATTITNAKKFSTISFSNKTLSCKNFHPTKIITKLVKNSKKILGEKRKRY